jgi:trimeric autotransporter adhesin
MDQLQSRLDALERQMHTVTRRLRWWRGLACGAVMLAVLTWALPLSLAREDAPDKDKDQKGLAQRVAALEDLLKHFSREQNEIFITGANLHLVNGLDSTDCTDEQGQEIPDCPNGLGNLIVGYNELRQPDPEIGEPGENIRTGSHNVVVGQEHNFSRFGGIVVGRFNTISGDFAAVSGGISNTASGNFSPVSGGSGNTASGRFSSVSGGHNVTQDTEFG